MSFVIFDLDGTLARTNEDLADSVNAARASLGFGPTSLEAVTSFLGCGIFDLMRQAVPELHTDDEVKEAVRLQIAAYDKCFTNKTRLYPQVQSTLQLLSQKHTLAVFTNKVMYQAQEILKTLDVAQYFKCIIGNEGKIPLKPSPESMQYVAQQANMPLDENAWIVGDNWTDILAGNNVNIKTCFCSYGFGQMRNTKADAIISNFDLLLNII